MRRSYVVEVLFTLVLFTVFVLGSFFILLFGADAYRSLVERQQDQEEIRLTLSYISTRVHSAPSSEAVFLSELEGVPCLMIEEELNGKTYATAIFWQDGELIEAFSEKSRLSLAIGVKITDIAALTMSEENGRLFLVAQSRSGKSQSLVLSPR